MKTIKLVCCLAILVTMGCKKESETAQKEEVQEKKIQEIIPDKYLNVLKEMGMTINEGTNPPDITGIYLASPLLLLKTNVEGDYPLGYRFADARYSFSGQNANDFSIQVASKQVNVTAQSQKAAISGSGNNFTVYSMETVSNNTNSAVFAYLYSGVLDGNAIKDLKMAFINVDNSNGGTVFMAEGKARISYDADNTSERVTSLDASVKAGAVPANRLSVSQFEITNGI